MPYGQQINPEQYAEALNAFDTLQKRENHQMQMNRTGNPYAILGAALGGLVANKFGKYKDNNLTDVNSKIEQYHAQQQALAEQKAAAAQKEKDTALAQRKLQALIPELGEQGAQAVVFGGAKYSDVKQKMTNLQKNVAAAGYDINTPAGQQFIKDQLNKKTGTTVNVGQAENPKYKTGAVPTGYFQQLNTQGVPELVKMQGGAPQEDAEQANRKRDSRIGQQLAEFRNIDEVGQSVLENVNYGTSGILGEWINGIWQPSKNLASNLDTLKADATFSKLQSIRENSPTGGAVGNMSDNEGKLMGAATASLDQSQSPEQLKENVERFLKVRKAVINRFVEDYKTDYGVYPKGFEPQLEQDPRKSEQSSDPEEGKTATNPETGQRIIKRNGQWVSQ